MSHRHRWCRPAESPDLPAVNDTQVLDDRDRTRPSPPRLAPTTQSNPPAPLPPQTTTCQPTVTNPMPARTQTRLIRSSASVRIRCDRRTDPIKGAVERDDAVSSGSLGARRHVGFGAVDSIRLADVQ